MPKNQIFSWGATLVACGLLSACGFASAIDGDADSFGRFSGSAFGAITFYGFDDNEDGLGNSGSAAIAYPELHDRATEDLGTFDQPSTFAADRRYIPRGTRIYIPRLRKYFVMEDMCGACVSDASARRLKVDLFIGSNTQLQGTALRDCQHALTEGGYRQEIIFNPAATYPVSTKPLFKDGVCNTESFD